MIVDDVDGGGGGTAMEKKSSVKPANRNERAGTLVRAADDFWVHTTIIIIR